jgi:hypothetical protein
MATVKSLSIERHLIEMRFNQAAWRRRPVRRKMEVGDLERLAFDHEGEYTLKVEL